MSDSQTDALGQLFRVDVLAPPVTLSLGAPRDDFGYAGVSLKSGAHYFVSIAGNTRYQHTGAITTIGMKEWLQYAKRDWQISTAETAMIASGSRILLSAGGGHYESPDLESGWTVAAGKFNTSDHNDIVDPVRYGVRAVDDELVPARASFDADLGYGARSAALVASAGAIAGMAAKLQALLTGSQPNPTVNSPAVDILSPDEPGGLIGALQKADRVMARLKKWTSRPETAPLIGQAVEKLKTINEAYKAVLASRDAALAMVPAAEDIPKQWDKRRGIMENDAAKVRDGGAVDKISGGLALVSSDWSKQITVPVRRLIVEIGQFTRAVTSFLIAIKKLVLGPTPRPVIGLIAKRGISMITHERVFGFAPDGFHFVSGPTEDGPQDWASKLQAMANAADNAVGNLLGDKIIRPKAVKAAANPGFFVSVLGDIRLTSKRTAILSAIDPDGVARVEAGGAAELTARDAAGISARKGAAEVLGRTVGIGIPDVATAKKATLAAMSFAAAAALAKSTTLAYQTAATAAEKLEEKYDETKEQLDKINLDLERRDTGMLGMLALLRIGGLRADRNIKLAELFALDAPLKAAITLRDSLNKQRQTADDAYALLIGAAAIALDSKLAKAAGWEPESQMLTEEVVVAATEDVAVFGGKNVKVESAGAIKLATQPIGIPASLELTSKVEIMVGPFKVTVTAQKVTVNNGVADVLTIDPTGAQIVSGPASVKVSPADVTLDAPLVTVAGKLVQLG